MKSLRRALRRLAFRPVASHDLSPVAARRDALASALLDETLDGLAGLAETMRLGPIDLDDFTRTLVASLDTLEIEDRSERAGSVRALGVLDARGLDFDAVYVLGLDDGTFPAARSESPLCPDALKRQLNPLASDRLRATLGAHVAGLPLGGLLRTARESSLEEPFLFFLTLSMAERELVLSYPAVDESGSTTVRSPFLDEVDACLGGGLIPERADPGPHRPGGARRVRARGADRPRGAGALDPPRARPAHAGAARRPGGRRRAHERDRPTGRDRGRPRPLLPGPSGEEKEALTSGFVGRLSAAAPALAARLDGQRWHPTSLEQFATCGFKFFAARVLGLEDSQLPTLEVDFRERGHALPRRRRRALPAASGPPGRSRRRAGAGAAGGRRGPPRRHAHDRREGPRVPRRRMGSDRARPRRRGRLRARDPAGVRGGRHHGRAPDRDGLRATFGPVALTGRPDRVELHRQGGGLVEILVRDYKLSGERQKYGKLAGEQLGRTSLQIPVYLLLAQAHVGCGGGTRG